jgi:hypothetical protein
MLLWPQASANTRGAIAAMRSGIALVCHSAFAMHENAGIH